MSLQLRFLFASDSGDEREDFCEDYGWLTAWQRSDLAAHADQQAKTREFLRLLKAGLSRAEAGNRVWPVTRTEK